jgi:hypothetical protein
MFKTNSGNVLHLSAKHLQQRKQDQHEIDDDEEEDHILVSPSRLQARAMHLPSSAGAALTRSASFHPNSSERMSTAMPRLDRSATFNVTALQHTGDDDVSAERARDFRDGDGTGRADFGLENHDEDAIDKEPEQAACEAAPMAMKSQQETARSDADVCNCVDFLMSHVPACAQLQPQALTKVLKSARVFALDSGSLLVRENETASGNCIWIVLEGMLQVTRTAVRFASAQQQLVQRVLRKKACIDPAPMPPDTARVFHTGITVRMISAAKQPRDYDHLRPLICLSDSSRLSRLFQVPLAMLQPGFIVGGAFITEKDSGSLAVTSAAPQLFPFSIAAYVSSLCFVARVWLCCVCFEFASCRMWRVLTVSEDTTSRRCLSLACNSATSWAKSSLIQWSR